MIHSQSMHYFEFKKIHSLLRARVHEIFPSHISAHLKELYISQAILNFALMALLLFEPIYLYTLSFPLWKIMLFYAGVYLWYFFLAPLGGRYAKQKGFEHGIIVGSLFLIVYLVCLIHIGNGLMFFLVAQLLLALQKSFFWPAYHADFAYFSESGERGREVSMIVIIDTLAAVIGPFVGGILATFFGFPLMFTVMCIVILFSNIPFLFKKEEFTPSPFEYREPFRYLFLKEESRYFWGYFGFAEELIVLSVWPIFLYLSFSTIIETGALTAFSTFVTACVVLYLGHVIDFKDRRRALKIGVIAVKLSWFLRWLSRGAFSILFLDFFSRVSRNMFMMPLISGLYEYASQHSIVKNILFMEMALSVGKIFVALLLAGVFYFFGEQWNVAFGIAGVFSTLYFFLARKTTNN